MCRIKAGNWVGIEHIIKCKIKRAEKKKNRVEIVDFEINKNTRHSREFKKKQVEYFRFLCGFYWL